MNIERFKTCVKATGLDIKKLRDLETLRISQDGKKIRDVRYSDVFPIVSFREWFNKEVAPLLETIDAQDAIDFFPSPPETFGTLDSREAFL